MFSLVNKAYRHTENKHYSGEWILEIRTKLYSQRKCHWATVNRPSLSAAEIYARIVLAPLFNSVRHCPPSRSYWSVTATVTTVRTRNTAAVSSAHLTMLHRAIAKGRSVYLSVRSSVYHTRDPRLTGSGYQNTFHTYDKLTFLLYWCRIS